MVLFAEYFPLYLPNRGFQQDTVIRNIQNVNNNRSLIVVMNSILVKYLFFLSIKIQIQKVTVDMFVVNSYPKSIGI